mmetsp:Transcript_104977/g.321620  ORF Transcript_104977/g.321620 Transcript_104977/m.321620 type:complete len:265 (+) Transcript_104977:827-1621(+)
MDLMVFTFSGVNVGWSIMSLIMVGTPVNRVILFSEITLRASPASHRLMMYSDVPEGTHQRNTIASAVMWNSGTASSTRGSGSGMIADASSPTFMHVPTLRCVCTTPLGKPVLPEVYMSIASSSGRMPAVEGTGLALPAFSTSAHVAVAPISCALAASPRTSMAVTPKVLKNGWHNLSLAVSAMRTFAPESFTAYSSSEAPHMEFKGTATAPHAVMAKKAIMYSGRFRMAMPTLSPRFTPKEAMSSAPRASSWACTCPKVCRSSW